LRKSEPLLFFRLGGDSFHLGKSVKPFGNASRIASILPFLDRVYSRGIAALSSFARSQNAIRWAIPI
jgi:hypothetical protein